jgi:transposase
MGGTDHVDAGYDLVGLDVHAAQTHAAVLDVGSGELRVTKLWGPPEGVVSFLEGLGPGVRAVYEAGPTGFGLARTARERGIALEVVAPGSIPRGPGDRVKTDRRDAMRLARLLAAGELRFAFVPSVAEEQFRDLTRALEAVRGDLMRARHRLSKLLLRRGLRYPGPGSNWTLRHMSWLRGLSFDDPCSRASFADYLAAVELLVARRSSLREALERAVPLSDHAEVIARLRCFRGIDTLSAAGLAAEVGDFRRFPRPTMLAGYLGVVPSERTSDLKRRQGSITKAGPPHARRLLVRGRASLPRPASDRRHRRPSTGRPGSARDRGRLARPAAPLSTLATPACAAAQAGRHRRDRLRPRARHLLLGGRRP